MKKLLFISVALLAAMAAFSSCQPETKPDQPKYYSAYFDLGIEDLEFKLYDFTVTYYDVRLEEYHTSVLTGQLWNYSSSTYDIKFDKFVLKVEGKLKSDASKIVKELVTAGKPLESGYFYTFKAGYYEDDAAKKVITTLVDDAQTFKSTVSPDKFEAMLSQPTISIIDIVK